MRKILHIKKFKLLKRPYGIILIVLFLIAVFGDFIANERPIYCKYENEKYFPVFHLIGEHLGWYDEYEFMYQKSWANAKFEESVYPPISFSTHTIVNGEKPYQRPLSLSNNQNKIHWLGTDQIGRDVASGIIHGTRIALVVGILSMVLAALIGISLGAISGFFGNNGIRVSFVKCIVAVILSGLIMFYWIFGFSNYSLTLIGLLILTLLFFDRVLVNAKSKFLKRKIALPIDHLIMRIIELFKSIPALIVLLALLAIIERPGIWHLILIIGLIRWPFIARLVRAEMFKVREMDYILASRTLGQKPIIILWKHAIPNAIQPAIVAIAFGIASAIILEATLSFLGIGLGPEDLSWGRLLSEARKNFSAWWLAVFPGFCIFLTVYVFNKIGEYYSTE